MAVLCPSDVVFMPPNGKRMRFHSLRDLSPVRTGVEGLRSQSRGRALRTLIGVKLKELSAGFSAGLEYEAYDISVNNIWRCIPKELRAPKQQVKQRREEKEHEIQVGTEAGKEDRRHTLFALPRGEYSPC